MSSRESLFSFFFFVCRNCTFRCVCVYTNRGGIMMERRKFDRRVAAKVSRWWKTRPSAPFFVQRREYNQTSRSCIRYIGECWLGVIFVQQWKSVAILVVERGWWWRLGFKYRAAIIDALFDFDFSISKNSRIQIKFGGNDRRRTSFLKRQSPRRERKRERKNLVEEEGTYETSFVGGLTPAWKKGRRRE